MTQVFGWTPAQVLEKEDEFVALVDAALTRVSRVTAKIDVAVVTAAAADPVTPPPPGASISLSDLAIISNLWAAEVSAELAPYVVSTYEASVDAVFTSMQQAFPGIVIPQVSSQFAETYLAGAANRLQNIGDLLWENARTALLEGFTLGESIPKLRDRVVGAAGVTQARANVIARTEIIAASNMGSFQQVLISGLTGTKEWLATNDDRTRLTHHEADGQQVDITGTFTVGGASLMVPGDPTGPPEEIIQCRCSVDYDLTDPGLPVLTAAAANAGHTGAMIALRMTEPDARALEVGGFEDANQLHTTLMYLGDAADLDEDARMLVHSMVATLAESYEPIETDAFSINVFNPHTTDRETAVVLGLRGERSMLDLHRVMNDGIAALVPVPPQHTPWVPHITLAYTDDLSIVQRLVDHCGAITFDSIRVAFADQVTDYPLRGSESLYPSVDTGGDTMPWRIVENSPSCPTSKPYAVVKEGTGRVEGCHDTRASANAQLRALYANEPRASLAQVDCPPGEHRMPDGTCMKDDQMPGYMIQGWEGPLVVEGVETGDGRMFAPGALTWPDLPVPLLYQRVTSHGGGTDESVNVGRIDSIWREGDVIMGRGVLDMNDPNAVEAARKIKEQYLRGVSIDADSVTNADVEFVYPEAPLDGNGDTMPEELMGLFMEPDLMIFHSGRIRATTLVNIPAFVEAHIQLVGDEVLVASARKSGWSDMPIADSGRTWDAGAAKARIGSWAGDDISGKYARAFLYEDSSGDPNLKGTYKFPIADIISGTLTIVPAGVRAAASRLPNSDIPAADKASIRSTLDSIEKRMNKGQSASTSVIVASGSHTITIPDLPDESWFMEPDELPPIGAVWVTDEGRIFGCVGPSGVAHRAFGGKKVTIPMGNVDYTAWMNRPTIVAGGKRIATGVITMDCGHMSPYASDDPGVRMEHYDNSCSAAAVVCIGESKRLGVPWIAGALLPMDAERLQRFMACQLSGDWAPHRERHGWKEFVAALTVPVPGFARRTNVASVRVEDGVIVSSAVPIHRYVAPAKEEVLVSSAVPEPIMTPTVVAGEDEGSYRMALGGIRARVSQNNRAALGEVRDRVRTTANPTRTLAAAKAETKQRGVKMSGCRPCDAAKAARLAAQQGNPTPTGTQGFGDGDGEAAAQQSAQNAIAAATANASRIKRG